MYEEDYGEEMDYEDEMEEDADDMSEDDDSEGLGEIEGLPGDVGVDVEVVMHDHDDEDGSESEESEDMSEENGDDIEIVHELNGDREGYDETGDDDEWESEEDDEEGYVAEPQAEGEQRSFDQIGGPLGSLVRALGRGGDPESAEEMLERLGEEGLDLDEGEGYDEDMQEDGNSPF
jgi:E3 ubiquitin-protein ligase HUWE1